MIPRTLASLAFALLCASSIFAQQAQLATPLRVLNHVPAKNALGVAQAGTVSVTFNQPLDASSVDAANLSDESRAADEGIEAGGTELSAVADQAEVAVTHAGADAEGDADLERTSA